MGNGAGAIFGDRSQRAICSASLCLGQYWPVRRAIGPFGICTTVHLRLAPVASGPLILLTAFPARKRAAISGKFSM